MYYQAGRLSTCGSAIRKDFVPGYSATVFLTNAFTLPRTLAGLLAHYKEKPSGSFAWRIAQGVEMGRPSTLMARAEKADGTVQATWVGGSCVMVSEGFIQVD